MHLCETSIYMSYKVNTLSKAVILIMMETAHTPATIKKTRRVEQKKFTT